jgi:hypothetical protein
MSEGIWEAICMTNDIGYIREGIDFMAERER